MWTKKDIEKHLEVSKRLYKIKDLTFDYLYEGVSEYKVQQFILKKFKEFDLIMDRDVPIVAFNENTSHIHYFPKKKSKKLKKNSLVLIDIWARSKKGGPYADITWMGYYRKVPLKVKKVFDLVIKARDNALTFVRNEVKKGNMPIGCKIDEVARDVIKEKGYGKNFLHSTGHSLGNYSPHGNRGNLRMTNKKRILNNLGYTIEPGVYLKGNFGVRSEIDFYISKGKVFVSGPIQKELVKIKKKKG
ncbi:MAG: M24 family metallopeptidase [archaeon]